MQDVMVFGSDFGFGKKNKVKKSNNNNKLVQNGHIFGPKVFKT